jgi:prepilin-type N-terminal cleavage/methylation domain-containing protein
MYKYIIKKQNLYLSKRAFTLVELVIVLAVLAILASIMIPAFLGMQKKSQRAVDIASAKTLYMAGAVMLADDFEDMPNSITVNNSSYNDGDNHSEYLVTVREYLGTWPAVHSISDDDFFLKITKDAESIEVWLGSDVGDGLKFNHTEGSFDWPD